MKSKLYFLSFLFAILSVFADPSTTTNADSASPSSVTEGSSTITVVDSMNNVSTTKDISDIEKLTRKRCDGEYNSNCLKVDLIASLEKLGRSTDMQLLPGVRVVSDPEMFASEKFLDTQMVDSDGNVDKQLDELLVRRLLSYARSLSFDVQIFDKSQRKGKYLSSLPGLLGFNGRAEKKKGKWSGTLMTAGLLTGATLLWIGMSSLMAMAAKALAASLLSIVISIVTAYKSSGGSPHKSTTYEIVAKPVYSHPYSADLQQDPHATAAATGGRNMEWDKVASMSSRSEVHLLPIRDNAHQQGYRAHVRPIYKRNTRID